MQGRVVLYRGQWCLYWREDGQPRRINLNASSREEADRFARDAARLAIKPTGELISDYFEKYLADKKGRVANHAALENDWKALKGYCAHLRPEHIDRPWCQAFVKAERVRNPKISDGTLRRRLATLSAALTWVNPKHEAVIELPPPAAPRDRHLTRDEAQRLIDGAASHHVRLFIILALSTAVRASALLELVWTRVDFDRGLIDFGRGVSENKGRALVPMTNTARHELLKAKEGALSIYVIEHGGCRVLSVRKGFSRACKRAGLADVTPHVLRHTAAVWMAESGRPMSEISQFLGHSSTAITERVYARYSPDYLRHAAAALEMPQVRTNLGTHHLRVAK